MKTKLLVLICFQISCGYAQVTFQKTFGGPLSETGRVVQQTHDHGYVIAGLTSSTGSLDMYLLRTDSLGSMLWAKSYGTDGTDECCSMQETSDGGFILSGYLFGPDSTIHTLLIKTDAAGDTIWTHTYGMISFCESYCIRQTNDGGYISGGVMDANNYLNIQLVKTNSQGDLIWTKSFGGNAHDYAYSIRQTIDGGYIIGGQTQSFGNGIPDMYLVKVDSNGTIQWSRAFGGAGIDIGMCAIQTSDGGYVICGRTQSFGAGLYDVYAVRTNSFGDTLWTKTYGGALYDAANFIQQTSDDGFIISGSTQSFGAGDRDVYLVKTDSGGNVLWTKTFGDISYDEAYCVYQIQDSSYVVTGNSIVAGTDKIYVVKTDAAGSSGCHETSLTTEVNVVPTQVVFPVEQITFADTSESILVLSVNSFGAENVICSSTAVPEFVDPNVSLFISPNPVSNKLNFSIRGGTIKSISISNLLGEKVFFLNQSSPLHLLSSIIDVSSLMPGLYFIKAETDEGIASAKFVKE